MSRSDYWNIDDRTVVCGEGECDVEFTTNHPTRKYCDAHKTRQRQWVDCDEDGCEVRFKATNDKQYKCSSHREAYKRPGFGLKEMTERVCAKDDCEQPFETRWGQRKFCDEHKTVQHNKSDPVSRKTCALKGCQKKVPSSKRSNAKFCSSECASVSSKESIERSRIANRDAHRRMLNQGSDKPTARRGEAYEWLMDEDNYHLTKLMLDQKVDAGYLASLAGVTKSAILRGMQAVRTTVKYEELKKDWRQSWRVRAMLPTWKLERLKELGPKGEGSLEFERLADELTRAYSVFSRFYFNLEGKRPKVEDFHLIWIRSIIVAYAVGGKQNIISPPRHGKSQVLVRFAVWFIVMFPNIRIMWMSLNSDVAKLMLGSVKDILTNNERLMADALPPGDRFKPKREAGRPWSKSEIKVAQQTHIGQASSTMLALGRTSKVLSRDVDLLIVDDLEDFDTTREAGQREYSRNKFAEIGTRKEEMTGWVNICSRQHPDDIPSKLMALEGSALAWRNIVNTAHDDGCGLDPEVIEGHDENGCVLFPSVRSYRWLMEKKLEMDALGIPGAYEMRYLNRPIPESGIVFDIPLIREMALDRSRGLGLEGLPDGQLVGGLDPSARGVQASFLWHYTNSTLSMVDLDTHRAGGTDGAIKIIIEWYEKYGVSMWFYENVALFDEFYKMVKRAVQNVYPMIDIKGYRTTGRNKMSAELGISAMAPLYHNGFINLPYGTAESRQKVSILLRQLELWTTDGVRSRTALTDVKMAQWFPFAGAIERWLRDDRMPTLSIAPESSYPGYGGSTPAPWAETQYPGA